MKKVALITGGTRGIGFGIAESLAAEGWQLVLNGMRPEDQITQVLRSLSDENRVDVIYAQGNVGSADDRKKMLRKTLDHFGHINLLVNNAGVAPLQRNDILETSEESFDRVININLKGNFFLTQAVAKTMLQSKELDSDFFAAIINISSISATVASVSRPEYCISKAGVSMNTQLFAVRLGEADIPVYEIRPGITQTDMTSDVKEKYDALLEEGLCLQKRWAFPKDVGLAVASLARNDFPYSTGQIIMIDGGLTVSRL